MPEQKDHKKWCIKSQAGSALIHSVSLRRAHHRSEGLILPEARLYAWLEGRICAGFLHSVHISGTRDDWAIARSFSPRRRHFMRPTVYWRKPSGKLLRRLRRATLRSCPCNWSHRPVAECIASTACISCTKESRCSGHRIRQRAAPGGADRFFLVIA